ncbi:hypothetical protein [Sorangium cellulosum]|uniref:hypothetical protein n=1 Tax=Sorangium cellulosum TaxID=56 RepID=UPI001331669F|nr:hypothetical protein [Sorangium cellulosum]
MTQVNEDEDTPPTIARLMRWGDGFFEGIACLESFLHWIRSGSSSVADLVVDPSTLSSRVEAFESALSELKEGVVSGEMEGGPPVGDDDIDRAHRLTTLLKTWTPGSDLPSEVATLAEQLVAKFGDEQEQTTTP